MRRLLPFFFLICLSVLAPARPNIIFILVDDMGWGDLGVFYQNDRGEQPKHATPHLDSFAAEGMQLRRHYAPAPVCAPSRASLLLGVHQGHCNLRNNQFDDPLDDNHTLASVLKEAGYTTAAIGKWGLQGSGTPVNQPSHPLKRGFDSFFGLTAHLTGHYHYAELMAGKTDNKGQPCALFDGYTDITSIADKAYSTDLFTARAKKWLSEQQAAEPGKPFFLYLAHIAPHAQLNVPTMAYPAGKGLSGGVQWTGTEHQLINTASGTIDSWIHPDYASQSWPDHAKRYATMIRRVDDGVADLMQTLKDLGIDDNTLVVFASDNGPANEPGNGGAYTFDPRHFRSYGPFDGIKRDCWEGGMRVPALVRWPGQVPAGAVSTIPGQFQDWMATFAEAAGVPAPARCDGVSLLPELTGAGPRAESRVYVEYHFDGSTPNYTDFESWRRNATRRQEQALYLEGYKGVRYNIGSANDDFKIYDTLADPKESSDLAGSSDYFIGLQQRMKDRVLQIRRPDAGAARPYDSENIPPAAPAATVPGLGFRAFEGSFPWAPEFGVLTPAAEGTCSGPDPSVRTRDEEIGLEFTGFLDVPAAGSYTFYLTADGPAFLRLHDAAVIDADKANAPGTEATASIRLAAGKHPLRLSYARHSGGAPALSLQWSGPGLPKQEIPAANLLREGTPEPVPPTANPDTASATSGSSTLIDVLANDSDDGTPQPLAITSVTPPAHGSASIEDGKIRYTPGAGFAGEDRFSYTISDGADSASALVTVTVLPATAVLWLPFDESSGTTAHDVLGRPLGVLQNFPAAPWNPGQLGNALRFDGSDDRVVLSGQKGITGKAARTVSFWLNAGSTQTSGARPTMISWGDDNGAAYGKRFDVNLNHGGGYKLRCELNGGGMNFSTAAISDLRDAGWVHCAVVVPQNAKISDIRAFLNGVEANGVYEGGQPATTAVDTTAKNDVTIGAMADGTALRAFAGLIDDVRIFPEALDAESIADIAATGPDEVLRDAWFFRYSGNSLPTPADWQSDADGDGLAALLEYALGGNPTAAETALTPVLDDEAFRFARRRDGLPAGAYRPQVSETLQPGSWTLLTDLAVETHPTLPGFDLVRALLPPSDSPRRFVRLEISL